MLDVLESRCRKEISSETVADENMMFGRAVRSEWRLWAECPNESHDCAALPIPEQEVPIGEKAAFGFAI
ncbi:hypothetical protein [Amycolatopsis lexingtonensis]|uniref:hypothetical protein n=1 Tax=Amycolatopsis lexingtonensis TaxID=218822 RepID=UPI003F6FF0BF